MIGSLGIATGMAGCSGGGGGGTTTAAGAGGDGDGDGDGDSDGGATATDSMTATATDSMTATAMESLPRGGTFRIAGVEDMAKMTPFSGFQADYILSEAMYDRLTRVDRQFNVGPNLAKDWERNDDATVWTFMLQDDATFSNLDGQQVTAEDVKATYDYLTSDQFSGSASNISGVSSLAVVDEKTVEFTLKSTDLNFPKRMAETGGAFFIGPKSVIEDDPARFNETDFGSGPLTLTDWQQKNQVTFEAVSDYHLDGVDGEPLPYVDKLIWDIYPDEIQRANALSDGTIDAVHQMSAKIRPRVEGKAETVSRASGLQFPIVLDTKIEPFDDPKVRKAIKYALDREQIVAAVSGGGVLGHHSGVTPVHPNYNDDLPVGDTFGTTAQPEKAKSMLSDAGHGGGFEVKTFHYDDGYPQKETIAQLFQQQMKAVGIEFEIKGLTEETWLSDYWNKDGVWYITNYSTRVLGSTVPRLALRSEGPWNEANWSNADYDEAYKAAVTATDKETLAKNLKQAQKINHREGAWVGTYHPEIYGAHKSYVKNFRFYPTLVKDFVSRCAVDK